VYKTLVRDGLDFEYCAELRTWCTNEQYHPISYKSMEEFKPY